MLYVEFGGMLRAVGIASVTHDPLIKIPYVKLLTCQLVEHVFLGIVQPDESPSSKLSANSIVLALGVLVDKQNRSVKTTNQRQYFNEGSINFTVF